MIVNCMYSLENRESLGLVVPIIAVLKSTEVDNTPKHRVKGLCRGRGGERDVLEI